VFALIVLAQPLTLLLAGQPATCADLPSCRKVAIEAAEQKDFETFHDFAWRVMQKSRPNDPESMLLLARAQSLSGRPGDALVMLRRVASLGIDPTVVNSDDFERVRVLPGWPEVEAAIAAGGKPGAATRAAGTPIAAPAAAPTGRTSAKPSPRSIDKSERAADTISSNAALTPASGSEYTVTLAAAGIDAVGLAYDGVSRRFVVGDRRQNRLIVADEVFKRVNDLIGAGSGGFGALTALEIDGRRGDLWVTSRNEDGHASVHKLQLVSGRVLARIDVPDDMLPAALDDIAISEAGMVLLVDATGSRLLSVPVSGQSFTRSLALGVPSPSSVASANGTTYIAHTKGLLMVDGAARNVVAVQPAKGVVLTGLRRIRWHRGSLIAIQDDGSGGNARLVRIRLGRSGKNASAVEILDNQTAENGSALTVASNNAFYLAQGQDGPAIRRVTLK
jgi:hypothetical protein